MHVTYIYDPLYHACSILPHPVAKGEEVDAQVKRCHKWWSERRQSRQPTPSSLAAPLFAINHSSHSSLSHSPLQNPPTAPTRLSERCRTWYRLLLHGSSDGIMPISPEEVGAFFNNLAVTLQSALEAHSSLATSHQKSSRALRAIGQHEKSHKETRKRSAVLRRKEAVTELLKQIPAIRAASVSHLGRNIQQPQRQGNDDVEVCNSYVLG